MFNKIMKKWRIQNFEQPQYLTCTLWFNFKERYKTILVRLFILFTLFIPNIVYGEVINVTEPIQPVPSDTQLNPWIKPASQPKIANAVGIPTEEETTIEMLTLEQLLHDKKKFEALLTQALLQRNWSIIGELLPHYINFPEKDEILALYLHGAYSRQLGQHKAAIADYRRIIATDPSLANVRLDLAVMLVEDKQYEAAADQLQRVLTADVPPEFKQVATEYLSLIQKQQTWSVDFSLNYTHNKNVNNASSTRELGYMCVFGGCGPLLKPEQDMPQTANGINYTLQAKKSFNLYHNHNILGLGSLRGTHYWDNKEYSEFIPKISLGYQYQNLKSTFSLLPFYEYFVLGNKAYMKNYGLNSSISYWLSNRAQLSSALLLMKKKYHNKDLNLFNGHNIVHSLDLSYYFSPTFVVFASLDYQKDRLKSKNESSHKWGQVIGFYKEFKRGITLKNQFRYAKRRFEDIPSSPIISILSATDAKRRDAEKTLNITLWHRSIHLYGITPKLVFNLQRIDSNLSKFYSRKNNQVYVNFEKIF